MERWARGYRRARGQALGGINLFNHAAIGYVDVVGVAHVMILGGDDVNSPGSKQSKVMFY